MNFNRNYIFFLFKIFLLVNQSVSERIAFFHGIASYSHRVQTWPLAEALSKLGHEVTFISPFHPKEPNPNITELVPQHFADYVEEFLDSEFDINLRIRDEQPQLKSQVFTFAYETCEALFASPDFTNWLSQSKKFDLFIIDNCLPECGMAIANHLGAKHIIFNTVVPLAYEYEAIGYLPQSSAIPELDNSPPQVPMQFFERVSNTINSLHWRLLHYWYTMKIDDFLRIALNRTENISSGNLLQNTSLFFYTGDVITDYPRSLPPMYVNVAGIHCRESNKALPKNMEIFINSTLPGRKNDGFVYISLGSFVVSSNLPPNIKQIFFDVIKSFPDIKFLWKWTGEVPRGSEIPDNLFLAKWFPQIDVLGHPRIRGFVTQSGRPSTLEALYLGVPMISFPILGDQDLNANRMHDMGGSIKLEIGTVTFKEFHEAMEKMVYDPRVKARSTKLQAIFRDRPMTPVQTAVWWVEYVLRQSDTSHLQPAGNDQYWFVRRQVDVWAFLSITVFIGTVTIFAFAWKLWKLIGVSQESSKLKKS